VPLEAFLRVQRGGRPGRRSSAEVQDVQLLCSVVDEIRRDMRRLRVEDCVVALRMQQHLVLAPEHALRLQQLRALCFDALLLRSSWLPLGISDGFQRVRVLDQHALIVVEGQ
jgi:hypothetical protein